MSLSAFQLAHLGACLYFWNCCWSGPSEAATGVNIGRLELWTRSKLLLCHLNTGMKDFLWFHGVFSDLTRGKGIRPQPTLSTTYSPSPHYDFPLDPMWKWLYHLDRMERRVVIKSTWADTLGQLLHPHLPRNVDFPPRWGSCKKQEEERTGPDHHKMLLPFPIQMSEWWMHLVWLALDKLLYLHSFSFVAKNGNSLSETEMYF